MKTPMRFMILTPAVTALLALTTMNIASAQGPDPGPHPRQGGDRFQHALMRLDLSDEQRESIRGLFDANRAAMKEHRKALRDAREALGEQIHGDTFDEAAIRRLAGQVGAAETELTVSRASLRHQVLQLLNDDQKAELKEIQADRQERMAERREGRMKGRRAPRGMQRPPRDDW